MWIVVTFMFINSFDMLFCGVVRLFLVMMVCMERVDVYLHCVFCV